MKLKRYYKKFEKGAPFLLIFLLSCTASSPWQISHLPGSEKEFDSARLIYPAYDKVNGIAVEMVYTKNCLRTYLMVHSQSIPPYQGKSQEALVTLKTSGKTLQAVAPRHQGGQRLSLPPPLQDALIQALLNEEPVTIDIQGFKAQLSPDQFAKLYQQLHQQPFNIPFQLTFKL